MMGDTDKTSETVDNEEEQELKHFFAIYSTKGNLTLVKTNLPEHIESELEKVLNQRLQKALLFSGQGAVIIVDSSPKEESGSPTPVSCYYYFTPVTQSSEDGEEKPVQYIICFISAEEESLDLFHTDLDNYSAGLLPQLREDVSAGGAGMSADLVCHLEGWHRNSVEYLTRCKTALRDNLKYLIHSALLSHKLVTSGGTTELQTDLQRFYEACSLSDILRQLKEVKGQQDSGSLSSSIDMLVDMGRQTDAQTAITVSITEDSLKLDTNGCNKFCEEWANNLNRPEFQNNPAKLKHVIEVFKLKFIQTMNTLKRLLREADNDYYALYRSYRFLRDSGNSEILLHYITAEASPDTMNVLQVLQEFIKEQQI